VQTTPLSCATMASSPEEMIDDQELEDALFGKSETQTLSRATSSASDSRSRDTPAGKADPVAKRSSRVQGADEAV
jgi:hypothetical protein